MNYAINYVVVLRVRGMDGWMEGGREGESDKRGLH